LLEYNDSESVDLIEKNAELLKAAFTDNYKDIESAIATFDFDKVLSALNSAMQQSDLTQREQV
ncbi:MAG: hypothetical protein PHU01_15095, partial [Desulfuromonadaceae bacterium]|nr:hypothetical protein [Desulfuromonadaceae bacterium]